MYEKVAQISARISTLLEGRHPEIAVILGSGLGPLAENITDSVIIPYQDIDGFPQTSVQGHTGALVCGYLGGKQILCLQGRFHLYEGHQPQTINLVIKILVAIGIKTLIVTNAAGSLRQDLQPGSLMLIKDHINFSGFNPLTGPNDERFGPRFPDLCQAYCPRLRQHLLQIAQREQIPLREGVYLMVSGPNFETPAEIRAFQILGADAVGMSTVPEVICAAHSGLEAIAISVITNYGAGLQNGTLTHQETLAGASAATAPLCHLITAFIKEIN